MTIENYVQSWYTTVVRKNRFLPCCGVLDRHLYGRKGRVERAYFFYLFLAFRDRYIQVKGGIKRHLKVPENGQIDTEWDTFTRINRLTSEFESCIVHHENHTEKCGSFLLSRRICHVSLEKVTRMKAVFGLTLILTLNVARRRFAGSCGWK